LPRSGGGEYGSEKACVRPGRAGGSRAESPLHVRECGVGEARCHESRGWSALCWSPKELSRNLARLRR
jgi:hypothetical protein